MNDIFWKTIKNNLVYKNLVELRRNIYKRRIVSMYDKSTDEEIIRIIDRIRKKNELNIYNYEYTEKYDTMNVAVLYDKEADLSYVMEDNRPLYFKRGMTDEQIVNYYRGISSEQDIESPHCYTTDDFMVQKGSTVLDLGAAEGNFVFRNYDKIGRAILVECDLGWVEALEHTFKGADNVIIVKKMVTDKSGDNSTTIDELAMEYGNIDFIKMDIEGFETKALAGASEVLSGNNISLSICTYHKQEDYYNIKNYLEERQFDVATSEGYMTLYWSYNYSKPYLRRGLVRAYKK